MQLTVMIYLSRELVNDFFIRLVRNIVLKKKIAKRLNKSQMKKSVE